MRVERKEGKREEGKKIKNNLEGSRGNNNIFHVVHSLVKKECLLWF